jgi:hypothetical protein
VPKATKAITLPTIDFRKGYLEFSQKLNFVISLEKRGISDENKFTNAATKTKPNNINVNLFSLSPKNLNFVTDRFLKVLEKTFLKKTNDRIVEI